MTDGLPYAFDLCRHSAFTISWEKCS